MGEQWYRLAPVTRQTWGVNCSNKADGNEQTCHMADTETA